MSGRTPEEREAARQDRERRRGEREDPAAAPGVVAEPAADVEAEPRFEDRRSAEPPGAEHEPEPPVDDDDLALDPEAPAGTRRVSGLERGRSSRGEPRRARRQRAVRRRPARGRARSERPRAAGERRRLHIGRIISVVAILLAGALIWFLVELFQPFHGSGHGSVTVTIPADAGSRAIGDQLARDGVISSGFFFELRATLAGQRGQLRSGTYHLRQDMDYGSALKVLTTPPPAAKVTNLTVTEGRTRSQIDALLHAQGIQGSYLTATRHSPLLSPERYGAPGGTPSLEGFLFPSTYQLREPIKIDALIHDQLNTFRQRFAKVNLGFARGRHLTPYDVLIVASMVEAEAQTAHDRPLVASVIYNRLQAGMPLQIDATTRYATGNYTRPLTVSELNSSSPYNTRVHKGLPPTPINNPGMASIDAAARPAQSNYLYFVVKPCGNGGQAFTASYSQFLRDQQRYQAARTARGGRSPEHC